MGAMEHSPITADEVLRQRSPACGAGQAYVRAARLSGNPIGLPESTIANYMYQLMLGLAEIHRRKRVHLDIKPGNLLLTENNVMKIADFGTMQIIDEPCTQLGDFSVMAPEVYTSSNLYVGQSDVWSAGSTALLLADGEAPLGSESPEFKQYIHRETCMIPSLCHRHKWSPEFNDFVTQCHIREAEHRPTAAMLLEHPWLLEAARQANPVPLPLNTVVEAEESNDIHGGCRESTPTAAHAGAAAVSLRRTASGSRRRLSSDLVTT
eukprot:NODE_447_length_945_cov_830.746652_g344_i0.p1 GENE.NODE_447_length_945_cov_830.746652_g344_i0~~NODE_447_length_945_cov_830.746652_g344_i0.p1  ORF type:complete len:273 (+),score=45.09 NODE_447_length_945_cov_830.746652_g344_i0:25-819(+)